MTKQQSPTVRIPLPACLAVPKIYPSNICQASNMLEGHLSMILDSMQQYGFAIVNNLPSELLGALQAEAAAVLEQAEAAACADIQDVARQMGCVFQVLSELQPGHAARSSSQYWQQRSRWPCQRAAAAFLQSQPLLAMLQAVLGSRTVLLYNEQFIVKPPSIQSGSAFGWHYDSQYAASSGRAVAHSPYLSLWVALDNMEQENGCLVVLPGGRADTCCCVKPDCRGMVYIPASTPQQCLNAVEDLRQQHCSMGDSLQPPSPQQTEHKQQQRHKEQQEQQRQLQPSAAATAAAAAVFEDNGGHMLPAVGLLMPAGTAVLFWDDLWHCSGPNNSSHTRSAYMAQYSSQPLVWQDSQELVGLAVPL